MRWILDGLDMLLVGGLPIMPAKFSTVSGEKLWVLLLALNKKAHNSWVQYLTWSARAHLLENEVDGLRETNRVLTDAIEALERDLSACEKEKKS
jgi:uncharacterized protein YlxW (UPF0749 family)